MSGKFMAQLLHLQLLGRFYLTYGERPLHTVHTPRLQSLLAYLVLHRSEPQPRRQIAFALWPGFPEARARANLRKLFFQLQQALPEAADYFEADGRTIQWRADAPFWLDVAEFERLASQPDSYTDWQQAVDLYGGELLPDCYDDWIISRRERLRVQFIEMLDQVIGHLEQAGNYPMALQQAQRLLRHDPLRESTYRHLIRLHALNGDRAGVVRVYRTCVTALWQELGTEPGVSTQQAYESALQMITPEAREPNGTPLAQPNNLPTHWTAFIGREAEKRQVKHLLSDYQLVTLVGAGGVGKSRLAQAVAADLAADPAEFGHGVWWVDLAWLAEAAQIAPAAAVALGLHETPQRTLLETLVDYLTDRQMLLILDNCEHLTEAVRSFIEAILPAAPAVRLLLTSREPVGTAAEHVWRLPSLSFLPLRAQAALFQASSDPLFEPSPPIFSTLLRYESVWLFLDRATAVLPTFTLTNENALAVAEICARLDGIPLALELAAARIKLLTPAQIAQRLGDAFRLLTRGSPVDPARHQTLLATLDWSFALLEEGERSLLCRLAVFSGGCTLEAAEVVGAGPDLPEAAVLDCLAELVDKSLVAVEQHAGGVRYHLLEITRQYAWQKLVEAGEKDTVCDRHGRFYLDLVERAELEGPHQLFWLKQIENEQSNWLAALDHSLGSDDVECALRLISPLRAFWELRGQWSEGRRETARVLQLAEARFGGENNPAPPAAYVRVILVDARLAYLQGDLALAQARFEQALKFAPAAGDPKSSAAALQGLSNLARGQTQNERARELCLEALQIATDAGDLLSVAHSLTGLANIAFNLGDLAQAQQHYQASLALCEELGDARGQGVVLSYLGIVAYQQGNYPAARAYWEQQLSLARTMADQGGMASALNALGRLHFGQADYTRARLFLEESLAISRKIGERPRLAILLGDLGEVQRFEGDYAAAFKSYREGLELARQLNRPWRIADVLYGLGHLWLVHGDVAQARACLAECLAVYQKINHQERLILSLMGLAGVIGLQGKPIMATRLLAALHREAQQQELWENEKLDVQQNIAIVRRQLTEEHFAAAWAEGQALPLADVIQLALDLSAA